MRTRPSSEELAKTLSLTGLTDRPYTASSCKKTLSVSPRSTSCRITCSSFPAATDRNIRSPLCFSCSITNLSCLFYLLRKHVCWCCQMPGRRCWTGAPPSTWSVWLVCALLSPCPTAAPCGHLHLQHKTLIDSPEKDFSIALLRVWMWGYMRTIWLVYRHQRRVWEPCSQQKFRNSWSG